MGLGRPLAAVTSPAAARPTAPRPPHAAAEPAPPRPSRGASRLTLTTLGPRSGVRHSPPGSPGAADLSRERPSVPPAASLPLPRRAPSAPSRPLAPAPHPAQRVLKLPGHGTAPNASSSHTHPRRWPRRPSPDPRCPANPRPLRRGCPPSHKLWVSHPVTTATHSEALRPKRTAFSLPGSRRLAPQQGLERSPT